MAPFILYNITQNFDKTDSLAFWTFTDIFEENGPGKSPFHGGFGLINADGIKKPAYWAYWLYNQLSDKIIEISDDHIITKQNEDYQIIIWNYCYYKDNFANGDRSELTETDRDNIFKNRNITVNLSIDLNGEYEQTIFTLDKSTSAFHNWVIMGAPGYPTQLEIAALKAQSKPKSSISKISEFKIKATPHK